MTERHRRSGPQEAATVSGPSDVTQRHAEPRRGAEKQERTMLVALRVQSAVIAIVLAALLGPAFARPIDPDGDGPPGPPDPVDPICTRPATATATVGASPSKITLGDSATIIWAVTVPPKCTERARRST